MKRTGFRPGFPAVRGFTFIEILVVVAILGALALAIYPSINNVLQTRTFENSARDIAMTLERAKFQAVRTKLSHRVRFVQRSNLWYYLIETETSASVWDRMAGFVDKSVPPQFTITVSLPNQCVTFSSLGYVSDFTVNQNTITIQSERLRGGGQDDRRIVSVFAGGSVLYSKARSS